MAAEIKKWEEIKKEIEMSKKTKSVLLGNGFSLAWDYEGFDQTKLKSNIPYLSDMTEANVEECINKLSKCASEMPRTCKKAKQIMKMKINLDFIKLLFNKLPRSVSKEKASPFVNFLQLFDNYFTLNYDPLLYFLLNKYKRPNKRKTKKIDIDQEKEDAFRSKVQQLLKSKWAIINDGKNIYSEDITEESHTFIRKKLAELLGKSANHYMTNTDKLKSPYKKILDKEIADKKEGEIEESLKQLVFTDGFDRHSIWYKEKPCNLFYLHGAYHMIKKENEISKVSSTTKTSMMGEIETLLNEGSKHFTILDGDAKSKENKINKNSYLKHSFEMFKGLKGIIITDGVSFAPNDTHITDAILANNKLEKIYIGLFPNKDGKYEAPDCLKNKSDKIIFFETDKIFNADTPA